MKLLILVLVFSLSFAGKLKANEIETFDWEGIPVTWVKDNKFPLYQVIVYYADGALSDFKGRAGETSAMFDLLTSGTKRYGQKQINDILDYYGTSFGASVTHEYSYFSFSGLTKDLVPTAKMICHLMDNAVYPSREIKKYRRRSTESLKTLINSHSSLADRAFREISLSSTPFELPVSGKMKTIKRLKRSHLLKKKDYFNKHVKKKITLVGPSSVKKVKSILLNECGWDIKASQYTRRAIYRKKQSIKGPKITLVTVPKANQSQIRIGRFISHDEIKDIDLMSLSSGFLGGGFTSKLMTEVRVKRGLTYSINAFASPQRDYGRAGISTFTEVKSVPKTLEVVEKVLDETGRGLFSQDEFNKTVRFLAGNFLFKFENPSSYALNLIYYDHMNRSWDELHKFPEKIKTFQMSNVAKKIRTLFSWEELDIVVIGPKSLAKKLSKIGPVKTVSYKKYL